MKFLNIGILAHVDAGKTTLTENILYLSSVITKKGRVDAGDTQMDSLEIERRRGISIKASATSFFCDGIKVNLLDTPGHVDFMAEVERSLSVLDGVILVISAAEGLQSQTRILMDTIMAQQIPAVIFINKIDRSGANIEKTFEEANAYMGGRFVSIERIDTDKEIKVLTGDQLIARNCEVICSLDDEMLDQYVNNTDITTEYVYEKLSKYTKNGLLYPVFMFSAL